MKRWVRSNRDLIADVTLELRSILDSEGNGAEVIGLKSGQTYYLWVQETGPGYAIYKQSCNVWRDRSKDEPPIYFSSIEEIARWLIKN